MHSFSSPEIQSMDLEQLIGSEIEIIGSEKEVDGVQDLDIFLLDLILYLRVESPKERRDKLVRGVEADILISYPGKKISDVITEFTSKANSRYKVMYSDPTSVGRNIQLLKSAAPEFSYYLKLVRDKSSAADEKLFLELKETTQKNTVLALMHFLFKIILTYRVQFQLKTAPNPHINKWAEWVILSETSDFYDKKLYQCVQQHLEALGLKLEVKKEEPKPVLTLTTPSFSKDLMPPPAAPKTQLSTLTTVLDTAGPMLIPASAPTTFSSTATVSSATTLDVKIPVQDKFKKQKINPGNCLDVQLFTPMTGANFHRLEITFKENSEERQASHADLLDFAQRKFTHLGLIDDQNPFFPRAKRVGRKEVLEFYLVPPFVANNTKHETFSYYSSAIDKLAVSEEKRATIRVLLKIWLQNPFVNLYPPISPKATILQRVVRMVHEAKQWMKVFADYDEKREMNSTNIFAARENAEYFYRCAGNSLLFKAEGKWGKIDEEAYQYLQTELALVPSSIEIRLISARLMIRYAKELMLKAKRARVVIDASRENSDKLAEALNKKNKLTPEENEYLKEINRFVVPFYKKAVELIEDAYQKLFNRYQFKSDLAALGFPEKEYIPGMEISRHAADAIFSENNQVTCYTLTITILDYLKEIYSCEELAQSYDARRFALILNLRQDFYDALKNIHADSLPVRIKQGEFKSLEDKEDKKEEPERLKAIPTTLPFKRYLELLNEAKDDLRATARIHQVIIDRITGVRSAPTHLALQLSEDKMADLKVETAEVERDKNAAVATPEHLKVTLKANTSYASIKNFFAKENNCAVTFDFHLNEELPLSSSTATIPKFARDTLYTRALRAFSAYLKIESSQKNPLSEKAKCIFNTFETHSQLQGWMEVKKYIDSPAIYTARLKGREAATRSSAHSSHLKPADESSAATMSEMKTTTIDNCVSITSKPIETIMRRLLWFLLKTHRNNQPFDVALFAKLILNDPALLAQASTAMKISEASVTALVRAYPQRFSDFKKLQEKGVQWPHSSQLRREIEKAGFIFRPMMIKRDRCICETCGAEVSGWRPWYNPWAMHVLDKHPLAFQKEAQASINSLIAEEKPNLSFLPLEEDLNEENIQRVEAFVPPEHKLVQLTILTKDPKKITAFNKPDDKASLKPWEEKDLHHLIFKGFQAKDIKQCCDAILTLLNENSTVIKLDLEATWEVVDDETFNAVSKIIAAGLAHQNLMFINFGKIPAPIVQRLKIKSQQDMKDKSSSRIISWAPNDSGLVKFSDDVRLLQIESDLPHKLVASTLYDRHLSILQGEYKLNLESKDLYGNRPTDYALTTKVKNLDSKVMTKKVNPLAIQHKPNCSIYPDKDCKGTSRTIQVHFYFPFPHFANPEDNFECLEVNAFIDELVRQSILGKNTPVTLFNYYLQVDQEVYLKDTPNLGMTDAKATGYDDPIAKKAILRLEVPYSEINLTILNGFISQAGLEKIPSQNIEKQIVDAVVKKDIPELKRLLEDNKQVDLNKIGGLDSKKPYPNSLKYYSSSQIDLLRSLVLEGHDEINAAMIDLLIEYGADPNKEPSVLACCPEDKLNIQSVDNQHLPGLSMFEHLLKKDKVNKNIAIRFYNTSVALWYVFLNTCPADSQMQKLKLLVQHPDYDLTLRSSIQAGSYCYPGDDILTVTNRWLTSAVWGKDTPTQDLGKILINLYTKKNLASEAFKNKADFKEVFDKNKNEYREKIDRLVVGEFSRKEMQRLLEEKREEIHNDKIKYLKLIADAKELIKEIADKPFHRGKKNIPADHQDAPIIHSIEEKIKFYQQRIIEEAACLVAEEKAVQPFLLRAVAPFQKPKENSNLIPDRVFRDVFERIKQFSEIGGFVVEYDKDNHLVLDQKPLEPKEIKLPAPQASVNPMAAAVVSKPASTLTVVLPPPGLVASAPASFFVDKKKDEVKMEASAYRSTPALEKLFWDALTKLNFNEVKQHIDRGVDINSTAVMIDPSTQKQGVYGSIDYMAAVFQKTNSSQALQIFKLLINLRQKISSKLTDRYTDFYSFACKEEKEAKHHSSDHTLDYFTMRLTRCNFSEVFCEDVERHVIAFSKEELKREDSVSKRPMEEGAQHETLLVIRARTLLEWIIELKQNNPKRVDMQKLQKELDHVIETLSFYNDIQKIPIKSPPEVYKNTAENLITKLFQLKENEEYTLPSGWQGHAICVSFVKKAGAIVIRIDNLETLYINNHPFNFSLKDIKKGRLQIQPKIVGEIPLSQLNSHLNYFTSLIKHAKDLNAKDVRSGLLNLYKNPYLKSNVAPKENLLAAEQVPFCDMQGDANCYVKSFEPGLVSRMGPDIAAALTEREITFLKAFKSRWKVGSPPEFNFKLFGELEERFEKINSMAVDNRPPLVVG